MLKISLKNIYIGCLLIFLHQDKRLEMLHKLIADLINWKSKKKFCKYNLNEFGGDKDCVMCFLRRDQNTNQFKLKALGKFMSSLIRSKLKRRLK